MVESVCHRKILKIRPIINKIDDSRGIPQASRNALWRF